MRTSHLFQQYPGIFTLEFLENGTVVFQTRVRTLRVGRDLAQAWRRSNLSPDEDIYDGLMANGLREQADTFAESRQNAI